MGTAYTGIFRAGSDAHALWVAQWPSFEAKWKELSGQGLRLSSLSAYADGGQPLYAGTFRAGSGGHALWVQQWASFEAKWKELSAQGLRLTSLTGFVNNGVPHYGGVFREGGGGYALWVSQWASFEAKWKALSADGLRLVSLAAFEHNGSTQFGGVFRAGRGGHALWVSQWASFEAKWRELSARGLRLISIDTYVHNGQRYYAGAYGPGTDGYVLWAGADWESFLGKRNEASKQGLRLVDVALATHPCTSDCLNQVVMPTGAYDYGITSTATHCRGLPGTCGTPAAGSTVIYRWPVDVEGSSRYVRHSAIQHADRFLTLPFSDRDVKRNGIWRYGDGKWHHAADYSQGDDTFAVLACAAGRVIHVGWDSWSGNTVIVSHDVGRVSDAYRTIYMHLRNGATSDCNSAWTITVPTLKDPELADYKKHLKDTGCPQKPPRKPDPAHWGTDAQTIMVSAGQSVTRGQQLAWSGNTGPGGKRGAGGPNTHLHVFFTRRDPTNDEWYFFDPYGIYAMPDCYPATVTGAPSGPCVRYPVAWRDGRPQYP